MEAHGLKNTSGQGKGAEIPEGVKGWSWGAFLLNWIWGVGNNTFIALLMLIPFVGIVMIFVLGFKGREWAWRNKLWLDVDHFNRVQKKWSIAALLIVVVILPMLFSVPFLLLKNSEPYAISLEKIMADTEAREYLGDSISVGMFVSGNMSTDASGSSAELKYKVTGDKNEASAYVNATKTGDVWVLDELLLNIPGGNDKIQISTETSPAR